MRQSACLVINPITFDNFAALFNCTTVDRASDAMLLRTQVKQEISLKDKCRRFVFLKNNERYAWDEGNDIFYALQSCSWKLNILIRCGVDVWYLILITDISCNNILRYFAVTQTHQRRFREQCGCHPLLIICFNIEEILVEVRSEVIAPLIQAEYTTTRES